MPGSFADASPLRPGPLSLNGTGKLAYYRAMAPKRSAEGFRVDPLLCKSAAWLLLAIGALGSVAYPLREVAGLTLLTRSDFYSLALFGAAFIAWGLVLSRATVDPRLQRAVAMPAAVGFLLLAVVRVLALLTGREPFDIIPVNALGGPAAAAEAVLFAFLAYRFWTGAARHAG